MRPALTILFVTLAPVLRCGVLALGAARGSRWRTWPLASALALVVGGAQAADVAVTVHGVANARGEVLVAVCPPDSFLRAGCPYVAAAPARPGSVTVVVQAVPPGTYALQAFHDENRNLGIDRNFLGLPVEGIGFGNDAPMRFGPPRYADAALAVAEPVTRTALALRYLDGR